MNNIKEILIKHGYYEGYMTTMRNREIIKLCTFADIEPMIKRRIDFFLISNDFEFIEKNLQLSIELHMAHIIDKHCT